MLFSAKLLVVSTPQDSLLHRGAEAIRVSVLPAVRYAAMGMDAALPRAGAAPATHVPLRLHVWDVACDALDATQLAHVHRLVANTNILVLPYVFGNEGGCEAALTFARDIATEMAAVNQAAPSVVLLVAQVTKPAAAAGVSRKQDGSAAATARARALFPGATVEHMRVAVCDPANVHALLQHGVQLYIASLAEDDLHLWHARIALARGLEGTSNSNNSAGGGAPASNRGSFIRRLIRRLWAVCGHRRRGQKAL